MPPDSQMAPVPAEKKPLVFKVNIIAPVADAPGGNRFISAGEPSPYDDIAEVPVNLRAFVVTDEAEPAPDELNASFELNTVYAANSDGRRGRALSRQVARLEVENALRDWAEEQLSEPLLREVADALQAQNDAHIGRAMAEAEAAAKRRDQAHEAAESGGEENYDIST